MFVGSSEFLLYPLETEYKSFNLVMQALILP